MAFWEAVVWLCWMGVGWMLLESVLEVWKLGAVLRAHRETMRELHERRSEEEG